MKRNLHISFIFLALVAFSACSRKNYTSSWFEQQTMDHRVIAVLPAEMIFTGKQPKEMTPEDIARVEEEESRMFQESLYNGILRHANSRKYFTSVHLQSAATTLKILQDNKISLRDSWHRDDAELATLLGVDAVVRMRIQKERYMSDLASMGIGVARQIVGKIGNNNNFPVPYVKNKTNEIYASCNLVSSNITLWNDHYKGASDHNYTADEVIDNITDRFGKNFPYKKRK